MVPRTPVIAVTPDGGIQHARVRSADWSRVLSYRIPWEDYIRETGMPSLQDAPPWADGTAQDGDGDWRWHETKPAPVDIHKWLGAGRSRVAGNGLILGDWRDTWHWIPGRVVRKEFSEPIEEFRDKIRRKENQLRRLDELRKSPDKWAEKAVALLHAEGSGGNFLAFLARTVVSDGEEHWGEKLDGEHFRVPADKWEILDKPESTGVDIALGGDTHVIQIKLSDPNKGWEHVWDIRRSHDDDGDPAVQLGQGGTRVLISPEAWPAIRDQIDKMTEDQK